MLRTHAGAWIAAGWAHLVNGNLPEARERFERCAELDRNFAESLGSLAVVCFHEGKADEAQRLAQTALRLDRDCLSAALASSLLLASAGRHDAAARIQTAALHRPLGPNGQTIAQALSKHAARFGSVPDSAG